MKFVVYRLALTLALLAGSAPTVANASDERDASPGDPFAACVGVGSDPTLSPPGLNFPNTEPEVWLARNPVRGDNLIGAIQQDRWSDGGAKGLVAPWSLDNGAHWQEAALPFSRCAAPFFGGHVLPYDRVSDPWVDIGPDGTAYSVSVSFNGNDNNNAVGAATSTDGGRTWANLRSVITDPASDPTQPFNDKESVTANPIVSGSAYVVWDRLKLIGCSGNAAFTPLSDDRVWRGAANVRAGSPADLNCFEGPAMFSKTTDGGRTWSQSRAIVSNSRPNEQTIANQIVIDPRSGTLYNFYLYFHFDGTQTVEMVFSKDQGSTWSSRQVINTSLSVGVHDPEHPDTLLRTGDVIPEPAVDPRTGQLYVVWQDPRFNTADPTQDMLIMSTSTGGGVTGSWTAPVLVNELSDRAAFTPAIKVNNFSQVAVEYYSLRHHQPENDRTLPTETLVRITEGPGTDFEEPKHVGDTFNMLGAPVTSTGYFVGDYEGMAVDDNGRAFHTFFTAVTCDNARCNARGNLTGAPTDGRDPTDVYTENVRGER